MMGPLFQQTMKARLGLGKPLDGYSMTPDTLWGSSQPVSGPPGSPHMLHQWGSGLPINGIGINPNAPSPHLGGGTPIPFEPRPHGGTLPMESPWNPHQTPYQPRPQNPYETPFDPRQRGYEPRPQGGGMEQPQTQGWGGQTSPWRKF